MVSRLLEARNSTPGVLSAACWDTRGDVVTTKYRISHLAACLYYGMLSLRRVSPITRHRVWGRITYLSSMQHSGKINSTTVRRLINKPINNILWLILKITPIHLINKVVTLVSLRNLLNNLRCDNHLDYHSHPLAISNPKNTYNVRK